VSFVNTVQNLHEALKESKIALKKLIKIKIEEAVPPGDEALLRTLLMHLVPKPTETV
jgi:hypothetical protein